jgi:hypothetical protein
MGNGENHRARKSSERFRAGSEIVQRRFKVQRFKVQRRFRKVQRRVRI